MLSRGVFAEEKCLCTHTHIILLPWDFLGLGSDAGGGRLSRDATGPSFCSRAPTPRLRGPFSGARGGIVNGRGGGCFIFSPGSAASDACVLASCNKATAGALVTCSLLCCQAQTCRFLLRALACSPPPPPPLPCPLRALAPCQRGGSRCLGRVRRCLLPHAPCGRGPFNCSSPRPCPLGCPPCLALGCPAPLRALALLFPGVWGAPWQSQPSCRQVAPVVPSCAAQLDRGGPCSVCHAGAVQAAWHCSCTPCCAIPCRAAGSDTRALPAGPCCPFALTALVPAPSQCCWGNFCHWEIPLLPLGSLTGLPTPAAVFPWLCNLLPPARMAHEPSWLTGVCRVLLLLTPARGVLYP